MRLSEMGENAVVQRLANMLGGHAEGLQLGIGDDCAVVDAADSEWALTSDPVIEGRHFMPDTPRRAVGHKAVGRAISDLAAMGAQPRWILINIAAPGDVAVQDLELLYEGATALCKRYGAAIIGGDLAEAQELAIHVFAMGSLSGGKRLVRSCAKPGDLIFVSGTLGGSILGRHLRFLPRVEQGMWLLEQGWNPAVMDLSDGLGTDLRRMLDQSNCGAELDLEAIPVSADAHFPGMLPVEHALYDGEDFELLMALAPDFRQDFEEKWAEKWPDLPLSCIGCMTDPSAGLMALSGAELRPLDGHGFEHFK